MLALEARGLTEAAGGGSQVPAVPPGAGPVLPRVEARVAQPRECGARGWGREARGGPGVSGQRAQHKKNLFLGGEKQERISLGHKELCLIDERLGACGL